jgi:hypothetical protein
VRTRVEHVLHARHTGVVMVEVVGCEQHLIQLTETNEERYTESVALRRVECSYPAIPNLTVHSVAFATCCSPLCCPDHPAPPRLSLRQSHSSRRF